MKKEMKIGKEGYEVPSLTIVRLEATNAIMASPIDMAKGGVFINHQRGGEILDNSDGWDGWDSEPSSFNSGNSRGF